MKKKTRIQIKDTIRSSTELENQDHSPIIPQRSKLKSDLHIRENFIFTERQQNFLNLALDKNTKLLFVSGPAGSGKSFLSIYAALKLINDKRVSDLIYARSAVECSDRSIGLLPGTLDEKIGAYLQPLVDKLDELLPKNEIDMLKKDNRITGMPISFLRGLNWNAKIVIGDEFQNCTYKEILTFITRLGEFSKAFVLGDPSQNDINGKSGFDKMIDMFNDDESKENGIHVFRFTNEDIVRSKLIRFIMNKIDSKRNPVSTLNQTSMFI